ncbi:pentapeptide repeat-containing protein [Nostoc sp. 'Peltigera membranacea cyanobiont' N6]|uniref:pentapeptide repeat-containing protein n=1 Tax=Nostoc sp. 'Peltigera membranacea cyanobiont' N6 TaxID=1261031 RepID=UPI000CF30926|nr:pentapeptide repeat-containing protein [Nostoc sp. 'Peltigera membranacea cyanobiont' N6]AVH68496.1 pentapeptide repeat-containing protein [Nostoc sp. 'Peltigera membranacea cyanobiont' N6]
MPQDFSGQNLCGRSFKGQKLEGANFSYADIKSADFTDANLRGANFSHATAGLQKRWAIFLVCISWLLSGFLGFFLVSTGALIAFIFNSSRPENLVTGWTVLIVIIVVFLVILREGLNSALAVAVPVTGTLVVIAAVAVPVVFAGYGAGAIAIAGSGILAVPVAFAFAGVVTVAGSGVFAVPVAVAVAFAVAVTVAGSRVFAVAVAFAFAVTGVVAFVVGTSAFAFAVTGVVAFVVGTSAFAVAGILLSAFIAWRAIRGDEKYTPIRNIAVNLAATGGTSFHGADLTDADFTQATLKSTDLRNTILICSCWHQAKMLDRVRPGSTYLQNSQVRQLLVTKQGQDKNFDRQILRGINLKAANLADASFIGADLSEANLQDADLSRAKLKQTQLDGTDLTGATLTGAFIEDWGITNTTKLNGVRCEYVYMRLPTKENPDPLRKPDNNKEVFADGEFGDFIQPIFDTLDLYHNQGVDPRAIAISFKQLAENHPEADLRIVGMEVRAEDKFLLRAKTADTADKSQLSAEYFDSYNETKSLPEREIQLLLEEKDSRIRSLETMVMTALERPSFYSNIQVEEVGTMTNNPGGFSVGGSVGGDIRNLQGDKNRATQGDNNQGVLGDGNQVTQQNQVGADTGESLTKEDVVKLLAQLETLIKGAELPADTKEEVIEDLSAAKKATDKEEPNKQRALERLGTVAETLEKTSKGVEAGQKVWTIAKPIIVKVATWLGVAAGSHLLGL